jgi:hypothetical protein
LLDTLQNNLKRGQATGELGARVDAVDLDLSTSELAYFFLSNPHTLSWLLDRDVASPRRMAMRRRHAVNLFAGMKGAISFALVGAIFGESVADTSGGGRCPGTYRNGDGGTDRRAARERG